MRAKRASWCPERTLMIQLVRRMTTARLTVLAFVLALGLFATACSGSDSSDIAADTDEVADVAESEDTSTSTGDSTDEPSADAATEPDDGADDEAARDDGASTDAATSGLAPDDSTETDESAGTDQPEPDDAEELELELDQPDSDGDRIVSDGADEVSGADLEQILPFFGITDPAEAVVCIEEEASSEGLTLDDLSAGAGNGVMIAAIRCRPEPMRELFASEFVEIDSSSLAATPAQLECGFDTLLSWFPTVPLAEADDVFDGSAPDEVIDLISETCAMSREDADAFLNDA